MGTLLQIMDGRRIPLWASCNIQFGILYDQKLNLGKEIIAPRQE